MITSHHLLLLNTVWAPLQRRHISPAIPVIKKKVRVNYVLKCCHTHFLISSPLRCLVRTEILPLLNHMYVQHLVSICREDGDSCGSCPRSFFNAFVSFFFFVYGFYSGLHGRVKFVCEREGDGEHSNASILRWHPPQRGRKGRGELWTLNSAENKSFSFHSSRMCCCFCRFKRNTAAFARSRKHAS